MSSTRTVMTLADFRAACRAQGAADRQHTAVKCPVCGTVQSLASLKAAGMSEDEAEGAIGFACIGRHTGAGPFDKKASKPGGGCNWTLGGLLRIHTLEIETEGGKRHPHFVLASAEDAQALERSLAGSPGGGDG